MPRQAKFRKLGQRTIGNGNYGKIHKVECKATQNVYARKDFINHDRDYGIPASDLMDLTVLNTVKHAHVMSAITVSEQKSKENNSLSAIMEMGKEDLNMYITRHDIHHLSTYYSPSSIKRDIQQRISIVIQLLSGLHALHASGFISMDLKPANIIVFPSNQHHHHHIRITDFGISEFILGFKNSTCEKVTWAYRPPELFLKSVHYDESVDIWSLGAIMSELFFSNSLLFGNDGIEERNAFITLCSMLGYPTQTWIAKHISNLMKHYPNHSEYKTSHVYYQQLLHQLQATGMDNKTIWTPLPPDVLFLRILPNPHDRNICISYYGLDLCMLICDFIGACLHFDPEQRPSAEYLIQTHPLLSWSGTETHHDSIMNQLSMFPPCCQLGYDYAYLYPPTTSNVSSTSTIITPVYQPIFMFQHSNWYNYSILAPPIYSWILDCFSTESYALYTLTLMIRRLADRLHHFGNYKNTTVIPINQFVIDQCIATSIILKLYNACNLPTNAFKQLQTQLQLYCGLSKSLFNNLEQRILFEQIKFIL